MCLAKVGRFINADHVGYLGANGDLQSFNLFTYCSNNPVMYVDNEGNSAVAAVMGFSWITAIDGFLPIADIILGLGLAVAIAYDAINSNSDSKAESETKVDDDTEAVFYGVDMHGKIWKRVTGPMSPLEAMCWVDFQSFNRRYGSGATWGLYTEEKDDALTMATILSKGSYPILEGKVGEYPHYHVSGRDFFNFEKNISIFMFGLVQ